MKTIYLDPQAWDLALDASGNIALASEPYALAQDAASEIRTFSGECYYNTAKGIPYWQQILGHFPSVDVMKSNFASAALLVPGVVSALAYITDANDRKVTGQVQITDSTGTVSAAGF